jgi:hypothetical protein
MCFLKGIMDSLLKNHPDAAEERAKIRASLFKIRQRVKAALPVN